MPQAGEPDGLRRIPALDRLLRTPPLDETIVSFQHDVVVRFVRCALETVRAEVLAGKPCPPIEQLAYDVAAQMRERWSPFPRSAINATGVLLHTNLGRAPLSDAAVHAMQEAGGYSDLEYQLHSGMRGSRQDHVGHLLTALLPADAAHITVNSASAVLLTLAALARRRDVLVSRGQAVEIGGGFRVPEIMRESGARLTEVGTTNRTRVGDYEEAITSRAGALLHVHSSNFRTVGFTQHVTLKEMAIVARAHGLPLIDDNGSGSLVRTEQFGVAHEPMPAESLEDGSNVVIFSGDKLLGGPQAGIIVGNEALIKKIARHPLARAVRPDKITLAGLAATLLAYVRGQALQEVPILAMLASPLDELRLRVERWQGWASERGIPVDVAPLNAAVGGGSMPEAPLPSIGVLLPAAFTSARLRRGAHAVICTTRKGRSVLDFRSIPEALDRPLLDAVMAIADAYYSPKGETHSG